MDTIGAGLFKSGQGFYFLSLLALPDGPCLQKHQQRRKNRLGIGYDPIKQAAQVYISPVIFIS